GVYGLDYGYLSYGYGGTPAPGAYDPPRSGDPDFRLVYGVLYSTPSYGYGLFGSGYRYPSYAYALYGSGYRYPNYDYSGYYLGAIAYEPTSSVVFGRLTCQNAGQYPGYC